MRKIKQLDEFEISSLENGWNNSDKAHYRNRCKSILMSNEGYSALEISKIFNTRSRTIYTWFDRWEAFGIQALEIAKGRGRKAQLDSISPEHFEIIEKAVFENPQSLKDVASKISCRLGISVTMDMLKRVLKKRLFMEATKKKYCEKS